jgi:transcription antitermination protein NusB
VGARTKARKRALDVLYEADLRGADVRATLEERAAQAGPPIPEYTRALVEGVLAHAAEIDRLVAAHATDWTLERMPAVDRAVLRLGAYELLFRDDVPDAVAIDEAVELARSLSTEESPRFVNGVLGALARLPRERPEPGPPGTDGADPL